MNDDIIDAAVRAVLAYPADARNVMALAAQDIRAAALEEAGQAAMDCDVSQCDAYMARREIAVAIRALKEQAPSPPRTP